MKQLNEIKDISDDFDNKINRANELKDFLYQNPHYRHLAIELEKEINKSIESVFSAFETLKKGLDKIKEQNKKYYEIN